jgi:N6-L-threonylcarbamoyladenine synthase
VTYWTEYAIYPAQMKILAIDTSCDESCAAIVDTQTWRLLSDVVHSHVEDMRPYGGVVPEIASRGHLVGLPLAVHEALRQASLPLSAVDWFTVTNRPGLIGALLVGVTYAKGLAFSTGRPYSVMNHIEGHLYSPGLKGFEGETEMPPFPWIALVVSGGHTELYFVKDFLDHRWLGGTLDDAAGEAFDKVGKLLGLSYPAGPQIDRWVREKATAADRKRFEFPRAVGALDQFSYSGLKTAVSIQIQKLKTTTEADRLALAASAQEAILDALVTQARRSRDHHGAKSIIVTGGVACNSRLRERMPEAYFPSPRHCTDNAAMIALLSALYEKKGRLVPADWTLTAVPHLD